MMLIPRQKARRIVLEADGGHGAVREIANLVLKRLERSSHA